jgi:DNA adenine methylase
MRPPVHYYGGKTRLAPWLVSLMPQHRVYVEPFFGSGAVLFAKGRSRFEILNDLDGNVVNFFRVLRERPDDLARVCRLTPHARDEHAACALDGPDVADLDDLERARRWWARCVQGFGKMPGKAGWSVSTRMGSSGAQTCQALVDRFHACAERLALASIENTDAADLVRRLAKEPDALVYADPPYLGTVRAGINSKRLRDYDHDLSDEDDHRRLADALHATPATVLLSGYPSPLYDELYADWWRLDREVRRHSGHGRGTPAPSATEAVWSNRPLGGDLRLALDAG